VTMDYAMVFLDFFRDELKTTKRNNKKEIK
jgi:hypothetical protein